MATKPDPGASILPKSEFMAAVGIDARELGKLERRGFAAVTRGVRGTENTYSIPAYVEFVRGEEGAETAPSTSGEDPLVAHYNDRLEHWREIWTRAPALERTCDLTEMARTFGTDRDEVMRWLRMGAPFMVEGDWKSGDGFRVLPAHVLDWTLLFAVAAAGNAAEAIAPKIGTARER